MSPTAAVDLPPTANTTTPREEPPPSQQPPHPPSRLHLTHALNNPTSPPSPLPAHHIIASPYPTPPHHLDLRRLPAPSALLARALQTLAPASADYAALPYEHAFDWPALFATLRALATTAGAFPRSEFHVVAFRSVLGADADAARLALLDERSHAEAVASGGLLKYWFGVPDGAGRNLATCFWRSRGDAAEGGRGPWHRRARGAAGAMYASVKFETRRLTVEEGVSGWAWGDWEDGDGEGGASAEGM